LDRPPPIPEEEEGEYFVDPDGWREAFGVAPGA